MRVLSVPLPAEAAPSRVNRFVEEGNQNGPWIVLVWGAMPTRESAPPLAIPGRYRARNARSTPLYRLFQDHLEEFFARRVPGDSPVHPSVVEKSLRAFLECGVFRFGMVLPKRLRYFVHRSPGLAGEASRILAREIELHYRRAALAGSAAQIHFIQRFGSSLNLHLHVHAVVSDGMFSKADGPFGNSRLGFQPGEPLSDAEVAGIVERIRRKTLRRFVRLGIIPPETARELLSWEHSGFSLHAATVVAQGDRAALERLLYYCARPAVSMKRLTYRKEEGLAVYDARDKQFGERRLEFRAVEFIGRLARLIPPPRKNVVRYYGALGPNSPLRPLVREAATALSAEKPLAGVRRALVKTAESLKASARAWARCLSRVFEVDPLICTRCGDRLEAGAAILDDRQIARVLAHLGLPADFPTLAPARSPPAGRAEDSRGSASEGKDWLPPDDDAQACADD